MPDEASASPEPSAPPRRSTSTFDIGNLDAVSVCFGDHSAVSSVVQGFSWAVTAVASGVVGSAAWEVLRSLAKHGRQRFNPAVEATRAYAVELATFAVAAKLDDAVSLDLVGCKKRDDHWYVTFSAHGKTYHAHIPLDDPSEQTISVDLD